jgi:hypothetical protein
MNRTQITLAGLLAAQLLLIVLVRSPFSSASAPTETHPLLPDLAELTAARVELLGDEDRKVTLVREGDDWSIEELDGFPADASKVDELIDSLRELKVRRPVVTGSGYHGSFKVKDDDNEGRVKVWGEGDDKARADLILGSSPNYRAVNVRRAGEDPVYEVREFATYDVSADTGRWIQKSLLDVPADDVTGLTVSNAAGTVELVREDGTWRAAGLDDALDADAVDDLVRAASSVQLANGIGARDDAAQGFDGGVTVTLRWVERAAPAQAADDDDDEGEASAEGASETAPPGVPREAVLHIGAALPDNDGQRFITRDDGGFTGAIWASSVQSLLDAKLEDLKGDTAADSAG